MTISLRWPVCILVLVGILSGIVFVLSAALDDLGQGLDDDRVMAIIADLNRNTSPSQIRNWVSKEFEAHASEFATKDRIDIPMAARPEWLKSLSNQAFMSVFLTKGPGLRGGTIQWFTGREIHGVWVSLDPAWVPQEDKGIYVIKCAPGIFAWKRILTAGV